MRKSKKSKKGKSEDFNIPADSNMKNLFDLLTSQFGYEIKATTFKIPMDDDDSDDSDDYDWLNNGKVVYHGGGSKQTSAAEEKEYEEDCAKIQKHLQDAGKKKDGLIIVRNRRVLKDMCRCANSKSGSGSGNKSGSCAKSGSGSESVSSSQIQDCVVVFSQYCCCIVNLTQTLASFSLDVKS